MTDPASLLLTAAAAVVALLAGWLSLPSAPELEGERWFKLVLATLLRGVVEAEEGDIDAWEARVCAAVPYHPAFPQLDRAIVLPEAIVRSGSHESERESLEALSALSSPAERLDYLLNRDHTARVARLSDPQALGSAYDPARLLGRGIGWDGVADWVKGDRAIPEAMSRVLPAVIATVGEDGTAPPVLAALQGLGATSVALAAGLEASLSDLVPQAGDRLIVVAAGEGAGAVLRALADSAGLRDRVLAVVCIGGALLGGVEGREARHDWMQAHFTDARMDLEAHRRLLCLSAQWIDPTQPEAPVAGLLPEEARFPAPRRDGPGDEVLHVVDLGLLPASEALDPSLVARALWLTAVLLVLNERGSR